MTACDASGVACALDDDVRRRLYDARHTSPMSSALSLSVPLTTNAALACDDVTGVLADVTCSFGMRRRGVLSGRFFLFCDDRFELVEAFPYSPSSAFSCFTRGHCDVDSSVDTCAEPGLPNKLESADDARCCSFVAGII